MNEKLLSDVRPSEEAFSKDVLIFRYHLVPVWGKDLRRAVRAGDFYKILVECWKTAAVNL